MKKNQTVRLVKGFFRETCDGKTPQDYDVEKIAIMMIDNDTFSGAESCLKFSQGALQEGSIIILDDFFSYKGSQTKGICGAFFKWTESSGVKLRKVCDYGMGGVVYIVSSLPSSP